MSQALKCVQRGCGLGCGLYHQSLSKLKWAGTPSELIPVKNCHGNLDCYEWSVEVLEKQQKL